VVRTNLVSDLTQISLLAVSEGSAFPDCGAVTSSFYKKSQGGVGGVGGVGVGGGRVLPNYRTSAARATKEILTLAHR